MNEIVVESSAKVFVDLNEKIRVLHVDDDLGLLEITKQILEMQGLIQVDTALSVGEAFEKLDNTKYDVIISDYQMPIKDGLEFLKELRGKGDRTPFIIFTGKGREEVAINALNLGANQYVNKSGETDTIYAELTHSVTELAKTKKNEEARVRAEKKYRELADQLPVIVYEIDLNGRFTFVNEKAFEMTGYSHEEFEKGLNIRQMVVNEDLDKLKIRIQKALCKEKIDYAEYTILRKDGSTFPAIGCVNAIVREGKVAGLRGIVTDITEHKKTEQELIESEKKYRDIFENARDAIYVHDLKGKIISINKVVQEYGYTQEQIVGRNILKFIPKKYWPKIIVALSQLARGKRVEGEIEVNTPFGTRSAEYRSNPIIRDNKVICVHSILRDITERKRAEGERRRFDEKLSALNTYGQNLNTAKSMEEIYCLTLDAMQKVLGFEYADLMMIDSNTLCIVDHLGYPRSLTLKLPLDGSKRGITTKVAKTGISALIPDITKNEDFTQIEGLSSILSELAVPIKIGHKILGVLNVESKELNAFDEKDQKLLEVLASHAATAMSNLRHVKNLEAYAREIRESQEKFERFFMDNPEASVYLDSSSQILDINPRFSKLFGYTLDEVKGKHINDVLVPKDKMSEGEKLDKEALKGYVNQDAVRKRKDGTLVPVSISAAPITIENEIIGIVGLYKDNTRRKRHEERLSALNVYGQGLNTAKSMEEIYGLTMDVVEKTLGFEIAFFMIVDKDMLRVVDRRGYPESFSIKLPLDGTKKGVSVKAVKTGKSINVSDVEKENDWVEFMPGIRSGLDVPVKIGHKVLGVIGADSKKLNAFNEEDQELLEILASHAATAISNLEYAQNLERLVQERTQKLIEAQKRLVQAERLAAIGEVAAMVSHDLRNPLAGIAGATYYLKTKLGEKIDEKTRGMLAMIEKDIEHSNQIITDLLDYSREIRLELRETTPQFMTKESLGLVRIPNNVQIVDSTCDMPKIEVDTARINRVFVNIIKNAIDAMPEGGTLTIKSTQDDSNLKIIFTDTGAGMSKEVMEKLWTPFFTTKARGMGLGLSICKRIVEAHAGGIFVESTVGQGTTFTVTLPVEPKSKG
jgi:PAS domain S-box-containing protein